ncbi:zeta toxin family protein [Nocardiopsis alba]|uniref:zeta toxin family protein n=1 Tax=Nocardiopsis alba TaxID=53437 RepID=UPI0033BBA0A0
MSRHRVSDGELHAIFEEEVMPFVFRNRHPAERPELVLLGAQPAAGKSKAQAAVFRTHPTVVPLSGDALRRFHPHYDALMEHDPLAMPNATAQASGAWVRMSIDHARQNGYSLLLEGIFRDPDMTMGTAHEFAESGYRVHVVALGVNERVSRLDSVNRYLSPGADANRWTPATAHDLGYRMSPHTVQAAEDSPHVHRITITDRTGQDLFTNTRTPEGEWAGPTGAKAALLASRERPLPMEDARRWLSRREDYTAALIRRGELGAITRPTLERLHVDADSVALQAWPAPGDAWRLGRHRSKQRVHRYVLDSAADGVPNELLPTSPVEFLLEDVDLEVEAPDGGYERERQRRARLPADRTELEAQVRREARVEPTRTRASHLASLARGAKPFSRRPARKDPEIEL